MLNIAKILKNVLIVKVYATKDVTSISISLSFSQNKHQYTMGIGNKLMYRAADSTA